MTPSPSPRANPYSILDEHAHLRRRLDDVREALIARRASGAVVASLFEELHRVVLDHFEHEEDGGYFAQALFEAPRLSERAEQLLGQHVQMAAQLAALRSFARQTRMSDPWWDELHELFDDFLRLFEQHESEENTLLYEAFNVDIGAED
jgi:hemerythrin